MSEKYKFFEGGTFFVTLTVMGWIDIFTRKEYCDIFIEGLNFCIENKGLMVYSYCIMPSHIHMIISVEEGSPSNVIRDLKGYSAKRIIREIENSAYESRRDWLLRLFASYANSRNNKSKYQLWQHQNHPISLDSSGLFDEKVEYISNNPIAAGIVDDPSHYVYCSQYPLQEVRLEEI